jgi:hypothetical protein
MGDEQPVGGRMAQLQQATEERVLFEIAGEIPEREQAAVRRRRGKMGLEGLHKALAVTVALASVPTPEAAEIDVVADARS